MWRTKRTNGVVFPYPREVNCAGNYVIGTEQIEMFPPPREVNGGSYPKGRDKDLDILVFTSPRKVAVCLTK